MTTNPSFRRLLPWAIAVLLSLAAAFGAIKTVSIALEGNFRSVLDTEIQRRSLEIAAVTMNSNVMGSVAALGTINQTAKGVLRGVTPLDHPAIMETLQAIGESYHANGVYLVNSNGIIQSCWYTIGVTLTGVDVKFRPYFQTAMQGKQIVYAAIGTTTGERALYFAAPLYDEASTRATIIGAAVARLDIGRIEYLLKSWTSGPALLLSPQDVTYASNRGDLNEHLSAEKTPEQLKTIRALKQFGKVFDNGTPQILPFDIRRKTVSFENQRYAVTRVPVQWNDPGGEWTLVLLGNLDALMPVSRRVAIGSGSGAAVLLLSALFLIWRRRLQHANAQRERAQAELKTYTGKLEYDSQAKSFLAEISTELHQAASLADFARTLLHRAAPRVDADYGAVYVLDDVSRLLTPVGGYGALTQDLKATAIGQGLVGQCAKDMTAIAISDAAETGVRIVWGEGAVVPKSIILLPVAQADRLLGVIVLAALRPIDEEKRALLDAMVPMVAANLEILERNLGTQHQAELLQRQQVRLQETEAWYRGIIESAPDGMLIVDEQGVIVLTNPQIEVIFGYDAGALVGQKIEVLVPPEIRSRYPALREIFEQNGCTLKTDLRGMRRDGSEFPVEVGLSRLPALGGRGLSICASVRDISERRESERKLSETMALQKAIFENVPAGIFLSTDGIIRQVNPGLSEVLGATEQSLVGQPTSILFPSPEVYAAFGARAGPLLGQGKPVSDELDYKRPDGRNVICRVVGRPVLISGFAKSAIWLLEDITERRQNEERLRRVLEDSPVAVTMVEQDGTHVFSNRRLADMLGIPPEQMKNRRTSEFWVEPERRAAFLERLKKDGRVDDYELQMRRDDGGVLWVLLNTRWITFDEQRLLLSWLYDITERKRAEESIQLANEEQTAIFEAATLAIAFVKDRVIVRGNSKLNELFGLSSEEQIGQPTRIWYPDDDAYAAGGGSVYQALERGETHQREQRLQRSDGTQFWCHLSGRAVDPRDLARGTVWMLEDISERRKAEDELKTRMEELERFGRLTVDREEKMIQLKEEINRLLEQAGKESKYKIVV